MEELIKKAKLGNHEAIEEIIEEIYQDLYKLALFRLKNEMDAQDALQNTNILIYKNIQNLKEEKYFKAWAIKILINECNKIYNKREKRCEELDNNIEIASNNDYLKNINGELDTVKILSSLDEKNKDIMYLYINNYKIKEIANIVDMNENTVKTRIKRSKKQLKDNYKYDRKKDEIITTHKLPKVLITSLLVILLASGLVYAAVTIINNIQEEKAEPIKVGRLKISMIEDNDIIKENMQLYDENIYFLHIKDYRTFKEKEEELSINFDENDTVNEETFEKYEYDVYLIAFLDNEKLNLLSVEPYTKETKIIFKYDNMNTNKKDQQAFCILVPKKYSENTIKIEYNKKETDNNLGEIDNQPEGAITFKFSEFYIENVNEFENIDVEYDKNQDIYYTKFLDIAEYKGIKQTLGLISKREIPDNDLETKNAILIFKKTNNKINLQRFKIEEGKPCIYIQETEEQYGNGITGMMVILKNENYSDYSVIMK